MVTRVIEKAGAGEQDLLFGIGTKAQTRAGNSYNINRIDKIHPLATVTDLAALTVADEDYQFTKILVLGFAAAGDGGGGHFWYDSTEPHSSHNGYTIIQAVGSSTNGCWKKILPASDTQTNFLDIGSDVNINNKFEGKKLWDTTNKMPVWARGSAPGDLWVDGTGATKHTPV